MPVTYIFNHVLLIHVLSLHVLLIQSMFYQSSPVHISLHAGAFAAFPKQNDKCPGTGMGTLGTD